MAIQKNTSKTAAPGTLLMDSSAIETRVQALGKQIADDYKGKNPHLVAVLKGASIFHADLVRAIPLELSYDFIAVSSYEDQTSSSGEVRILKDLDQSIEGKDVLLIEDIVDTGLTLHFLKKSLLARKPNSFKVVTLLNKPSQRRIDVRLDYIGFDIPDQFLVGYGLDYAQRFRNLSGIHRLDL